MDDELLERRLRVALRSEADALPFTITAAELERRARVGGGSRSSRWSRVTLLLAAAVAVGILGAGAIIAGLSNRPTPSPVAVATASAAPAVGSPTPGPALLPTLDELIAAEAGTVLAAQRYGPADTPPPPISEAIVGRSKIVSLGTVMGGGDYLVSVVCLGSIPLEVALLPAAGTNQEIDGPRFACDGSVRNEVVRVDGPASAFITYRDATSWRIVIRGELRQPPLQTENPVLPSAPDGVEELIRIDDGAVETSAPPLGQSGLQLLHVGAVAPRVTYAAELWCAPGGRLRLLFADETGGLLDPTIETEVTCDGLVHDVFLPLPLPNGSPVYVAAAPATHWSLLVTSPAPPIDLASIPGWQLEGGEGPSWHFESTDISISSTVGDNGGPLTVVVQCAGPTQDIDVAVDVKGILGDAFTHYVASCAPEGASTTWTFDTPATGFIVQHAAPAGTWTSLTLLSPAASPTP